ncbi:hypothetical protein [Parvularcula sp. LCG005]|uniref:hypothetical protein n=1 Tax=Parvularcula sp. LCG005 TaxID=3078805 RepID=UPI002941D39D|nr:hypothetical protein [Parvularcula sp. LCG005]WOI53676.1 hypothetical protein RUI03_01460 [Parvularcula sp. LCG005]
MTKTFFLARFWRGHRALTVFGIALLCLAIPSLAASLVDHRQLAGVSVWIKPIKFMLSTGLFLLTLAYFAADLPAGRRGWQLEALAWTAIITSLFEVGYITWQGAHGLESHFNGTSQTTANLYRAMGVAALLLTATSFWLGCLIARRSDRLKGPYRRAIVLGLIITGIAGIGSGAAIAANLGHWVGDPGSDIVGIPLLGWSRVVGDLRPGHFLAIHAMQILPVFGAAVELAGAQSFWARRMVDVFALALVAGIIGLIVLGYKGLPLFPY